jgi:hypothetical protein
LNASSRLVTLFSWLVIGAMLVGLWRFTTIGADTRPALPCEGANCGASMKSRCARRRRRSSSACARARRRRSAFLLDTGTGDTVLDQSTGASRSACASAQRARRREREFGFQPLVPVARLELGSLSYSDFERRRSISPRSPPLGVELAGILGMNVLGQTAFAIDFGAKRLVLDGAAGGPVAREVAAARDAFPLRNVAGGLFAEVRAGAAPPAPS